MTCPGWTVSPRLNAHRSLPRKYEICPVNDISFAAPFKSGPPNCARKFVTKSGLAANSSTATDKTNREC